MGNTSIIEINHDRWGEIKENPQVFVDAILRQTGSFANTGKDIPGGMVIAGFHRSDNRQNNLWEKFKKDLEGK
jgi:hypothetical protein